MQVAILAGGMATRLYPLTEAMPKSMVRTSGKPFLELQIELLKRHGVQDIVLCVGHLAGQIQEYFGDGSRWGVRIAYANEGEQGLGTAGALKGAETLLEDVFFVLFGDSYLMLPYRTIMDYFCARDKLGLMVVYRNENRFDTSDVSVADGWVVAYDKARPSPRMVYINEGLSILRRSALALLRSGQPVSLQVFFQSLISRKQLLAYETEQRFYEIGSFSGLREFEQLMTDRDP